MTALSTHYPALQPLFSVAESAEYCRVSRRTVERLIASGELPVVKVAGRTLIRRAELLALATPDPRPTPYEATR